MGVLLPVKAGPVYHLTVVDDDIADRLERMRLCIGSHGYVQVTHDQKSELMHRWIMGCTKRDGQIVDHVNRDRLDNRRGNLRLVTASENTQNRTSRALRGAYPTRSGRRFQAKAKLGGIAHYLGTYDTAEEAAAVAAEFRRQRFSPLAS